MIDTCSTQRGVVEAVQILHQHVLAVSITRPMCFYPDERHAGMYICLMS